MKVTDEAVSALIQAAIAEAQKVNPSQPINIQGAAAFALIEAASEIMALHFERTFGGEATQHTALMGVSAGKAFANLRQSGVLNAPMGASFRAFDLAQRMAAAREPAR